MNAFTQENKRHKTHLNWWNRDWRKSTKTLSFFNHITGIAHIQCKTAKMVIALKSVNILTFTIAICAWYVCLCTHLCIKTVLWNWLLYFLPLNPTACTKEYRDFFQSYWLNLFEPVYLWVQHLKIVCIHCVIPLSRKSVSHISRVQKYLCQLSVNVQYLSSEWHTTTLRHQLSPTEKVVSSGRSSTWLWIRYRSLLGRAGNRRTLDRDRAWRRKTAKPFLLLTV